MKRNLVVVFGVASLLFGGCTYRTPEVHVPAVVAPFGGASLEIGKVDVLDHGDAADEATVDEVRRLSTELLERSSCDAASAPRMRTDVRVWLIDKYGMDEAMQEDGMAALAYWAAPLGAGLWEEMLVVQVTVHRSEHDDDPIIGFGIGDRQGSIYAPARRRALADAFDHAFFDAAKNALAAR